MTDTVPAAAVGLPFIDDARFLPLDADLVEMLSADMWDDIGRTCRIALVGNRLGDDDYVKAMGEMVDDDPHFVFKVVDERVMLRAADRRDNAALDQVLSARGH